MNRNLFLALVYILLSSTMTINAQNPPNPMTDTSIIPAEVNKTSIYGFSGKRNNSVFTRQSDEHTQPSLMTVNDYGCIFKSTLGGWKTLRLTFDAFTYGTQKYIYFVSKGANNYFTVNNTNVTSYITTFSLSDGWTLSIVDLSKTTITSTTAITYLQWQTKEQDTEAYVANICIADEFCIPAGYPKVFQEPAHSTLHSIYSDTYGSMIESTTRWGAFITPSEYTDPISAKKAYKIESTAGLAAYGSGFRFNLSSANQKPIAELIQTYQKIRFDVWSPSTCANNYLRVHLYDTSASVGSVNLKAIAVGETNSWKTYEINLVDLYASKPNMTLTGIQFTNGIITTGTTIFIDNIYLFTEIPAPPIAPTNNAITVWSGESNQTGSWSTGASEFTSAENKSEKLSLSSTGVSYTVNSSLSFGTRNMLHLNIFTGIAPAAMSIKVSDGSTTREKVIDTSVFNSYDWNTVNIALNDFTGLSSLKTITITGTSGSTVYVDDIIIYEVTNDYPVARIYRDGTQLGNDMFSVKLAVEKAKEFSGDIEIAIIRNSTEDNTIYIDNKSSVNWNRLTIYPAPISGSTITVKCRDGFTDDNRALFMFENGAADVTINGKLNKTGASKSLILQGEYKGHSASSAGSSRKYNNIINVKYAKNITISDCKFQGKSSTNRAVGAIQSNANYTTITNNDFENCLFLGRPAIDDWSDASVISLDGRSDASNASSNVINVSGNHFYETEDVNYTENITYRAFIKVRIESTNQAKPVIIADNKIGGRSRNLGGGNMRIGYGDGAVQGSIHAIYLQSGYANGNIIDVDNTSCYNLVLNNEIAYIDVKNGAAGINDGNGNLVNDQIGSFDGITTYDGLSLVKGNKIHDINISSMAYDGGSQRYFLTGIFSIIYGGKNRIIIEDNELYNLKADFINDAEKKSVIIAGIASQLSNNSNGTTAAGTIRNNKIIFGHSGTHKMSSYSDVCAIRGRLSTLLNPTSNKLQLDIYNNLVLFEEFKLTASNLRSCSAINLMNSAQSDAGTINCYNNISYIQKKTDGSFSSGIKTPITGISHIINHTDGIVNIFHNTVFVSKDSGLDAISAALTMDYYLESGGGGDNYGTLNVWNNNFVNLNDNAYALYLVAPNTHPKSVYFDYNNYYVPAAGYMLKASVAIPNYSGTSTIKTFDNWKFSNLLSYFGKSAEQDFHSRFLFPRFPNAPRPEDWPNNIAFNIANLDQLGATLIHTRFLGGKESDLSNLKVIDIDYNRDPIIKTSKMTHETNTDLEGDKRRQKLPTMGAINTGHYTYWTGAVSSSFNLSTNWSPEEVPTYGADFDLVFDENAKRACDLPGDITVHDIYNDTGYNLQLGDNTLTVTGYIGQETTAETGSRIHALSDKGTIIFNGTDGHLLSDGKYSAAAQHIFPNTFFSNLINNLYLNNKSQYFVLLHGIKDQEPSININTITVQNDFAVINANETEITYPNKDKGIHIGGLNCNWYKTTLGFSGYLPTRTPNLSVIETSTADYTYRPFAGQRIPRHGIYNDEVYNLTSNSASLVSYHDKLYIRNSLNIANSKSFEIAAEKLVQVFGETSTGGGLIIKARQKSDVDEAALKSYLFTSSPNPRPNATFIYNPTKNNNNIKASVEMYSPAKYAASEIVSPGGSQYEYRWQYFGSPGINVSTNISGSVVYKFHPQGDNNLNLKGSGSPYWTVPGASDTFNKFDGYCIYRANPDVYTLTGTLTNDGLSRNLTYYKSPISPEQINHNWKDFIDASGDNLLANPYTAAIDITQIGFGDGLEKTVYIYNTGTTTEWISGSGNSQYLSSAPGQSMRIPKEYAGKTLNVSPDGTVTFPQFIPSMQGFTVKSSPLSTSANNKITISYDMIAKNDMPQRSQAYEPEMTYLLVELKQDGYNDKALLATNSECKKGFDNGWDGRTRPEPTMPLAIFTIEEEEGIEPENSYYQISTMDDFNDTYLGIIVGNMRSVKESESKTNELVEYELVFKHENIEDKLFLEDLLLSDTIDITEPGSSYKFYEPKSGEIQKRFRIFTKKADDVVIEKPQSESVNIYSYNKTILVDNKGEAGIISVYDTMGKCLMTTKVEANAQTLLDTYLQSGIYLVNVITDNIRVNKKIILE